MSISRFATIGLACLAASACTVVVREAEQPEVAPQASRPEPPPQNQPPVRVTTASLRIPPGHLPPPGSCRVWIEGTPPGRQARARSCHGILAAAPVGSWILYRPAQYQRQLRVRYLHPSERVIVAVRAYDAETGVYLRDLALGEDDDNMGPLYSADRPPTVRPNDDTRGNRRGNAGNRGDENRSGNAGDKSRNENRGNATGQADSTGNRRTVGGNSGNRGDENRPGNAGDKSRNENRGNATGQTDSTGNRRTVGGNTGNRGDENRSGNAGGESRNENRGNATGQTDSTGNRRTLGGNTGNRGDENRSGNAGDKSGNENRGNATGQTDTTGNRRTVGGNSGNRSDENRPRVADDKSRDPNQGNSAVRADTASDAGSAGGTSGIVTEGSRGSDPLDRSGRKGEADDTPLDTDGQLPLNVDSRHFPPRGQCRVWVPGLPAGRQAKTASCSGIASAAPAGAWILRRAASQPNVILVDYVDDTRAGVVVRTSSYDAATGTLLQAQQPQLR